MKITSVECLILDNQFPFVFIETDEGIIGLGECFRRQPEVTKTVVENILAPAIIGKDPVNTDQRFQDMVSVGNALEIGGAIWIAIAGLDIAMWDIKGKYLGARRCANYWHQRRYDRSGGGSRAVPADFGSAWPETAGKRNCPNPGPGSSGSPQDWLSSPGAAKFCAWWPGHGDLL